MSDYLDVDLILYICYWWYNTIRWNRIKSILMCYILLEQEQSWMGLVSLKIAFFKIL